MPATFNKFQRFSKLAEDESGKPIVYGLATFESPDLDREICDYESAVAVYRQWSEASVLRTTKAGQEPSLGNVRLQHGLDIGGKAVKIDYDDTNKIIYLGARPLNEEIHQQLKDGFYTGFSQGGSYAWRKCNECNSAMPMQQAMNFCKKCKKDVDVRYGLESLSEVSFVDSPCSGAGFEYVKSNGSKSIITFKTRSTDMSNKKTKRVGGKDLPAACFAFVGDAEKTSTWKLPIESPDKDAEWDKRHIRNAITRADQTKGIPADNKDKVKAKIEAAAKSHAIDVAAEQKKVAKFRAGVDKCAESKGIKKGMYTLGRFADIIQSLECLYMDTMYEAEYEGDESPLPDDISEDIESLIDTFLAMCEEETTELTAAHKKVTKGADIPNTKENTMSEELIKAAKKTLARHFGKAASYHTKMAKAHEAAAEEHGELHETNKAHAALHEEAVKVHKAAPEAEGSDFHEKMAEHHAEKAKMHKKEAEAHKGLSDHHEKMSKAHEAHAEECKAVAEDHDKEEAEKTAKAITAAEPVAVVKVAPVAEPQSSEFERNAIAKAQDALLKDPDFMEDVKRRQREILLNKLAGAAADASLESTVEPTAVKVGGPKLIARAGQNLDFAKENSSTSSGVGI